MRIVVTDGAEYIGFNCLYRRVRRKNKNKMQLMERREKVSVNSINAFSPIFFFTEKAKGFGPAQLFKRSSPSNSAYTPTHWCAHCTHTRTHNHSSFHADAAFPARATTRDVIFISALSKITYIIYARTRTPAHQHQHQQPPFYLLLYF